MNEKQRKRLSVFMSLILRHKPFEFGLVLEDNGWIDVYEFIAAIKERSNFKDIALSDIEEVIKYQNKQRFEISDSKIRAKYGHSVNIILNPDECEPPDFLYHGTSEEYSSLIEIDGLKPMKRKFVHLSADIETARIVGKRRTRNPIIYKVLAKECWESGVKFYKSDETIWLADFIPAKFLKKI